MYLSQSGGSAGDLAIASPDCRALLRERACYALVRGPLISIRFRFGRVRAGARGSVRWAL